MRKRSANGYQRFARTSTADDLPGQRGVPRGARFGLASFTMRLIVAGVIAGTTVGTTAEAAERLEESVESGPVKATVQLEPVRPLIGDPVSLTVTVVAEKDVELLMPEFGEALERFAIIDFVPRESIDDQGRTVAVQKYRLQPPVSGRQAIPPILIEYVDRRPGQREAPEGLDAYELLTERIEFEVQSVIPSDAAAELKPPLGRLQPLASPPPSRWPWGMAALIVLAAASPFAVRAFSRWRRLAKRRSAYEIARARLDRLLRGHGRPANRSMTSS